MNLDLPVFYAKILLFGEYGIIKDSKGLTLPCSFYKGCLKFSDLQTEFEKKSNESLKKYSEYLKNIKLSNAFNLDVDTFKFDIEKGMFFDSNIPQGYGVGSSGALVAAVFEKYSFVKRSPDSINKEELKELKTVFSSLEDYFHGTSSGIDPLICYMNFPILIDNKSSLGRVSLPEEEQGKGAIFLVDSGQVGDTEPMIQIFFEKLKNKGFRKTLKEEFIRYNDACIQSFLNNDMNPFFKNLKKLSRWAFEHLKPMIPESIFKAWEKGLNTNVYYLKLCGSGGGGYILGFTRDYEKTKKMLKNFQKEIIYKL